MDLSVIIVNYNVKYFLEQCLYSVLKACRHLHAEILVIDNNSTDGSREYLEARFSTVQFKWEKENLGFAKANNIALQGATGDFILFLNPDTIVPEDCFEKCISFFGKSANAGALGVHMIDGSGKFLKESKRSLPTALASFFKLAGFAFLFPSSKLFAKYYAGHLPEKKNSEVDVLAGAFMMLSGKCLNKVKGFDEDYFMYGEDIDLSYRVQKAGFINYYFPGTTIIHFKGESTGKHTKNYINNFYGAMQLFVSKHYKDRKLSYYFMRPAIHAGKILASIKATIKTGIPVPGSWRKPMQAGIIASQQRFDEMLRLIKYSTRPIIVKGRIAPALDDTGSYIGTFENSRSLIKQYELNELIFCEGELSFKNIIEKIQAIPGDTGFLFHAGGSNSIVGSSSKDEKGFFITKE